MFSSKFKENLADLRKRQGRVAGADVNVLGVMGTAFLLGLNNMHRRKVRTGLTCATLTLLTFVMISFTSVENDLVEEDIAIGKAPYQGMLIKKENFQRVSDAEYFAFQSKYGEVISTFACVALRLGFSIRRITGARISALASSIRIRRELPAIIFSIPSSSWRPGNLCATKSKW